LTEPEKESEGFQPVVGSRGGVRATVVVRTGKGFGVVELRHLRSVFSLSSYSANDE
jgi:hypothetical protein